MHTSMCCLQPEFIHKILIFRSQVQSPIDLAIAAKFAAMLRDGEIGGQAFSNIVGVGHSYGSVQLQALTATVPTALDGVILQGYSTNS